MKARNLAAIDLGTNSFHMLIVKVRPDGTTEPIAKEKETVRLGSGSGEYEKISADAIERGIQCLKRFKTLAQGFKAEIRAIATSALREADNRDEFLQRAKKEAGIRVEVISGSEEARLIYLGILQGLPFYKNRILMIDIGGGSTELLVGEGGEVLFSQSMKMGAVRLSEKFFRKETIDPIDIQKARFFIETTLSPFRRTIESLKPFRVVGSSGTITSIGSMVLAKRKQNLERLNGMEFSNEEFRMIRSDLMLADTVKKRQKLPGLEEKRTDIIVGGSLILEEIFAALSLPNLTISDYALREGIVYDTISSWIRRERHGFYSLDNIRKKAIRSVSHLYPSALPHIEHVANLSLQIFDQLQDIHNCSPEEREYLEAASNLYQVGLCISHTSYHKHSYYIIKNAESLVGFSKDEIEKIALIARYHRKSPPKQKHEEFRILPLEDQNSVKKLAAILRIADGLNRTDQELIVGLQCTINKDEVQFKLKSKRKADTSLEIYSAEEKKDLFEETFQKKVSFVVNE